MAFPATSTQPEGGTAATDQEVLLLSNPVLESFSVLARVTWLAVPVVTLEEEENLVLSDQEVWPLPPAQLVWDQVPEVA